MVYQFRIGGKGKGMNIYIDVVNQKMKISSGMKSFVAGSQQFVYFVFNLDEAWDGLLTFAQFRQGNGAYNQYLDENNGAYLPAEIGVGTCTLMLYGSNEDTIGTTNYLTLTIDENIFVGNAQSTEISQSLYTQLVTRVNTLITWNEQSAADLVSKDRDLQNQINAKADSSDLNAEINRARAAEVANANAIAIKANQSDVDALTLQVNELQNNEYVAELITDAVQSELNDYLQSGALANMSIEDGSITRSKVDTTFETTLSKADTAMQPSVYDPQNLRVDIFSYAQGRADTVQANLNTVKAEIQDAYTLTNTLVYNKLGDAIRGSVSLSRSYMQALLADYKAFTVSIVNELPMTGEPMVFYLVPNSTGDGYDKYWWITDTTTNTSRWDSFGSATTIIISELPETGNEDIDYILENNGTCLYYKWINGDWHVVGGSTAYVSSSLPENGDPYTDYYILNASGVYVHYRWISNAFRPIGSDTYTKDEVDNLVAGIVDDVNDLKSSNTTNETNITANTTNIAALSGTVTNLQQALNNLDVEGATYYATFGTAEINGTDTENVFTLHEVDGEEDTIVSQFVIAGGGGGGQTTTTTLVVERITTSPLVITTTDRAELIYTYSSLDGDNEEVDGTYTWKMGSTVIATGACVHGVNTYDVTDFCTIGTQKFTLTITDEGGSTVVKTWTVQKVDVRLESSFNDRVTYPAGSTVNFTYTPYGSVTKTVHFIIDGVEQTPITTSASGTLQSYSIPAQTHGAHLVECYVTAVINGSTVETEHIVKDIIWYDESSTIPVIGCIYRCLPVATSATYNENIDYYYIDNNGLYQLFEGGAEGFYNENREQLYYSAVKANQYDSTNINYVVYNPNTGTPSVTQTIDNVNTTLTMNTYYDSLTYKTAEAGVHTIKLICGVSSIGIIMDIQELDIDVSPITANLAFDFNPTGLSNSSVNRLWVDENNSNIALSVSNNFDWSNGGYQVDSEGNQYFCIKAGTSATFSYNLFGTDPKTQGMEFKMIFRTTNVKSADATFLSCLDSYSGSNVGLQMNTHEAYLNSSSDSLYIPYSEEDKIEFEFNINPLDSENVDATSVIMSYEDGVGMRPMIYDAAHRLYQYTPAPIIIGSQYCDIHIYRMKAYTSSLTDSNILSNFIADAPNASEIISRYNRNQIYDENNNLTPEALAAACPDLKIIKIECPQFTNNKSNFVKYTNVQCIHKNGDPVLDNWTFLNAYHSGQGTTSNEYGYSGRNIDIICCMDGENQYSSKITFDPNYKTTLILGDGTRYENGTGKVALSRTSVPNNWFNIKVNIASSENANNALLQKRYNDYLPYTPAAKNRDPYAKNDMEFFNCVVFVKETGNSNGTTVSRREFNDSEWHFYAIGNIGDSKKTDATRANNPDDMKEFCIEISDNTLPNAAFQTGVYAEYTTVENPTVSNLNSYYELVNGSIYKPTSDTSISTDKTYYTRGNINYSGIGTMIYPVSEAQWNNANNVKRLNLPYSFDKDDTDDYAASFEFRYDMGGETRDGDTTGLNSAERNAQRERNKQIFRDFYKWVVTSSDTDFVEQLDGWFIKESALYWYLFTERYTMIDNRSKNTFWHFGDTGVYREVPCPSSQFMDYYYERSGNEDNYVYTLTTDSTVNSNKTYYWKYAFEMWDYDNDTALGINNSGELTMSYGKEDTDYRTDGVASSGYIFNAADNVFWRRIRLLMDSQLRAMYQSLDSSNCWSSDSLINEYDNWQSQFPEELWRLDIERKYYRTYRGEGLNAGATPSPTPRYLQEMMNGRKKYQRRQFERDQAAYMGTKYLSSSTMADKIEFRCNTPISAAVTPNYDLTIVPYSDMYLSVKFGNTNPVQIRAKAGTSYLVKCPIEGTMDDTMFVIYCASRIQALNDISACYIHDNDFSSASKLQTLIIGNTTAGYSNMFLTTLNLGASPLLEYLDIRNCPNLTGSLNLASCINLIELRAEGTALTAVTFANYGKIATAHLPDTINTLSMRNLHHLTDLDVSYDYLESLTIENSDINEYEIVLDAIDTLQNLRLIGINWTLSDTTLLNSILAMNQSYLSGTAYISGQIRNQELLNYSNAWSDLTVSYNVENLVTQYLATYVNADGTTLYQCYVDRGVLPPNPISQGYISTPTKPSTAQYTFTFSGWDDITTAMLEPRTIMAEYTSTIRRYTINWYSRAGLLLETTTAEYGSEVVYSGSIPINTSEEGSYVYNVFNGWDKSTGYITGDVDVYARWIRAELPAVGKDLKDMNVAEIYGITSTGRTETYFELKDHIDIVVGSDFNFDNVESQVLADNLYLDGSTYQDTNIKLFSADSPSFTIAIDYKFSDTSSNNATLVSCFEEDGTEGFRLRYNTNPNLQWGSATQKVGYQKERDILVLRHRKGDNRLYVYAWGGNCTGVLPDSVLYTELIRSRSTNTEATLGFGAVKFLADGGLDYYAKGIIYWCKIWYADLGNDVCEQLSSWYHETWREEYCGTRRYRLAGNTSQQTNASFICNNLTRLGHIMHSTNTNVGGWDECENRTFMNTMAYNAMPICWKALIKKVKINASIGNMQDEIKTSEDFMYLPSYTEVANVQSSPYVNEGSYISWFTTNASRLKFRGRIVEDGVTFYTAASDPSAVSTNNIKAGDIWINTGNSNVGYMYVTQEELSKNGITPDYTASIGGGWVAADSWWLRSPYIGSATGFMFVTGYGNATTTNAAYTYALSGGFSI